MVVRSGCRYAQFTGFAGAKVQILTQPLGRQLGVRMCSCRTSSASPAAACGTLPLSSRYTHFTCFTSTKVQKLSDVECASRRGIRRSSDYLLYSYKSTNADASSESAPLAAACGTQPLSRSRSSVYLLYWYKSTNADACFEQAQQQQPPRDPSQAQRRQCSVYLRYN